tara:strand:- start:347 stop:541 length:195 start_codon:yes stop_codon:yes gene_type:complete
MIKLKDILTEDKDSKFLGQQLSRVNTQLFKILSMVDINSDTTATLQGWMVGLHRDLKRKSWKVK